MKFKKLAKSIICIFIVACVTASFNFVSHAATSSAIYQIYGDNMLFQQKEISQIAGNGPAGATIMVQLFRNSTNECIYQNSTTVNSAGAFEVDLAAPAGGYEEYTIKLFENGSLFRTLNNVVFGELWLASGQSNMQLQLSVTIEGKRMMQNGQKGNKWVRFLYAQGYSYAAGVLMSYAFPMEDIEGAHWVRACDDGFYDFSAVAYHFAEKLQSDLNMPVGILSANLGGSTIASWLSRETIESNYDVLSQVVNTNQYVYLKDWNSNYEKQALQMTTNFNMKISALRRFRINGMIWYQGESEMISQPGMDYGVLFNALQDSYTAHFKYTKGPKLPVVFTEIAAYPYTIGEENNAAGVMVRNYQYAQMRDARPSSRAITTINDVPLDWTEESQSIHPITKKPVGLRMAYAAEGLVYNMSNIKSAPTMSSYYKSGNAFYITMENVGDGLATDGNILSGFSICGSNGVYVEAEAKILTTNLVKVWSTKISDPTAVSYKTGSTNQSANLYSSLGGNLVMPAVTFNTVNNINYPFCWGYADWTDCEKSVSWHSVGSAISGYYPSWVTNAGSISFQSSSAFSGSAGIRVTANPNTMVCLEPNIDYISVGNNGLTTYKFDDTYKDWSYYTSLSFMVRNNTSAPIVYNGLAIYVEIGFFIPYIVNGQLGQTYVIPADGQWHEVIMDLEHQIFNGNTSNYGFSSTMADWFDEVLRAQFVFVANSGNLDVSVDDFRFGTANSSKNINRSKEKSHNMYDWYTAKAATCTESGYMKRVCQNIDCDYYETSYIAPTGHNIISVKGYPATCTQPGLSDGSHCFTCGQTVTPQTVIPAKGHTHGDWVVTVPATFDADGLQVLRCTVCNEILNSRPIEKLEVPTFEIIDEKDSEISIDNQNGIIAGLGQGVTDISEMFNMINCTFEYTQTQAGFGTGSTVTVKSILGDVIATYTVVIYGDITGDGYVDAFDVSNASEYINNFDEPTDLAYMKSLDIVDDGFLDATDLAFILSMANFE